MPRPQYIIEHMEEDDPDAPSTFPQWALLEYRHMLTLVGSSSASSPSDSSTVHFTSLSKASIEDLQKELTKIQESEPGPSSGRAEFKLHTQSISNLMQEWGVSLEKVCLLDPKAPRAIDVSDAGKYPAPAKQAECDTRDGPFDYFLFGGILGDDPPRDRTASLRTMGFPGRHLGKIQMTTDTALGVTKRVVEDGMHLNLPRSEQGASEEGGRGNGGLVWVDHPEIKFGGGASVEMPFRYMAEDAGVKDKRPLMPPGMRELIKSDLDRAFEF
ncbi:hypothetical protein K437DRAFT_254629 [Tilletiaria anomala UBC 951]|uniref:DUF431-domain-containing protein n=1 Tax=Tilletiaria anomala (strain ATCC 24038 / CBS 436.72 / UBC 951) TaxID=1037660 RepID=A0A066WN69_TILAU|nr:uncharacterized protein K437DRAFT_254629 [Tilletiaria anomala UBC 951]KDN52075.1 hypothetical protein K437DRAFT_254629 [Tilletiaria anomala UBC 951]